MASIKRSVKLESLVVFAKEHGASNARIISTGDVFVDGRVRLKCVVPVCSGYGKNLMCPPNVISVDEFSKVLGHYHNAILIQLEASVDSSDKSAEPLSLRVSTSLGDSTRSSEWQRRLLDLVGKVETEAFKRGFYFAAGFSGGECSLCKACVASEGGYVCRHPFEARPSMEAVGIDVVRTCEKAGMPVRLSSRSKVRWTGLVLID